MYKLNLASFVERTFKQVVKVFRNRWVSSCKVLLVVRVCVERSVKTQ